MRTFMVGTSRSDTWRPDAGSAASAGLAQAETAPAEAMARIRPVNDIRFITAASFLPEPL
jgi:hypothetical protein